MSGAIFPQSFVVVDVETTGLHPEECSLLSIGAVVPASGAEFYAECRALIGSRVEPDALRVNGCTMTRVHDGALPPPTEIVRRFGAWCELHSLRLMGGMNPRFDLDFLRAAWLEGGRRFPLSHRTVDMHSLAWARVVRDPASLGLPASGLMTDDIYALLGLPPEPQPHNALTGARREAEAFSILLSNT